MKNHSLLFISIVIMVMLIAAITGCGTAKDGHSVPAPENNTVVPEKNTVVIQDYKFQPAEITIEKGETITWINQDSIKHNATDKTFDSGLLSKGQSFKLQFEKEGTFDYFCTPHPYMKGKIIVKEKT